MAQNWYPFYVGDYARKTAHLSLLEHGAYRLLIDHYMATGQPLPDDPKKLYRICRARTPTERQSVLSTAYEFFTKDGSSLRSEKCDSVLNKQLNYSNSQSAKAKLRHINGNATAMLHARVTKTRTKTKEEVSSKKIYTKEFEDFWELYPRKDGSKAKAFESYQSAIKSGVDNGRIESGARAYADSNSREGIERKYIKHATTWLNQRCWESDYSPENPRNRPLGSVITTRSTYANETERVKQLIEDGRI